MPHCITCNPNCQRCHRKPALIMPVECPACGRYNPGNLQKCKRCDRDLPAIDPNELSQKANAAKGDARCFRCDPLKQPLCGQCLALGRTVKCQACGGFNLSHRKDCKKCGADLS